MHKCVVNVTYFGLLMLAFPEWIGRWRQRCTLYTCMRALCTRTAGWK